MRDVLLSPNHNSSRCGSDQISIQELHNGKVAQNVFDIINNIYTPGNANNELTEVGRLFISLVKKGP